MTHAGEAAVAQIIRQRLSALEPQVLELYDESAEHVGHAGAASGGGHYRVLIVSRRFQGERAVARHRLVYRALGDLMPGTIHALAITAYTPEELEAALPAQ
jgi:BolA protein